MSKFKILTLKQVMKKFDLSEEEVETSSTEYYPYSENGWEEDEVKELIDHAKKHFDDLIAVYEEEDYTMTYFECMDTLEGKLALFSLAGHF